MAELEQLLEKYSILDAEGGLYLHGAGHRFALPVVDHLQAVFPDVLDELQLYWDAYGDWKLSGSAAQDALLQIWHMAEPGDTDHMTYGDDTESVVIAVRELFVQHRRELLEQEIETFELVIDSSESLGAEEFAKDDRNSDPQWEAGYRAGAEDLAVYLRQKVAGLRSALAELESASEDEPPVVD